MATTAAALDALLEHVDTRTLAKALGYKQDRVIRETIDRLRIPYITVRRGRRLRPADYFAALEHSARPRSRGRPRRGLPSQPAI